VGLDPKQIIEIRELIKNLKGEHTVILSSHILPEIEQTCERVVIINEGRVVAEDTVENLTSRLKGGERSVLIIKGNERKIKDTFSKIETIKSFELIKNTNKTFKVTVESESDIRSMLAKNVVENDLGLLELSSDKLSLEDIFLHLTTKEEEVA